MEFALIRLKTKYPDFELLLCGHSLGGSIAQIAACRISKDELFLREKIQLITFGMPKIGNKKHAEAVNALVPRNLRVVNQWDLVRFLPPWLYCHAGDDCSYLTYCLHFSELSLFFLQKLFIRFKNPSVFLSHSNLMHYLLLIGVGCEAVVEKSFWDFRFIFPVKEHCGYLGFTTS